MEIPDNKRFFRIGEVSRIIGVRPYVLRYWESEFPTLRPKRADSRQRIYKKEDIETLGEFLNNLQAFSYQPPATLLKSFHNYRASSQLPDK